MSDNKEVKITFTMPREYYEQAKASAEKHNVSITQMLRRAIKTGQYLDAEEEKGRVILIDDGKTMHKLLRI